MSRAATPEPSQTRRFHLEPLFCAGKGCKVEATTGDKTMRLATLGWLCRQCRQQQQSPEVRR